MEEQMSSLRRRSGGDGRARRCQRVKRFQGRDLPAHATTETGRGRDTEYISSQSHVGHLRLTRYLKVGGVYIQPLEGDRLLGSTGFFQRKLPN